MNQIQINNLQSFTTKILKVHFKKSKDKNRLKLIKNNLENVLNSNREMDEPVFCSEAPG